MTAPRNTPAGGGRRASVLGLEGVLDEGECAEAIERAWRECVTGPRPHAAVFNMVGRHFVHHLADVQKEFAEKRAAALLPKEPDHAG